MSGTALAEVVPLDSVARRTQNGTLLEQYALTRSPAVLDQIVRSNQRLLHHLLKKFAHAEEQYEDLVQVANLGLIKAAQNFDASKGVQFSTYAGVVVEGEIRHYLRDSLLLRQPRWFRRIYGQIEEATIELGHRLGRPPKLSEIAQAVNVSEAGVLEVMGLYSRIDLVSLDQPGGEDCRPLSIDRRSVHSLHAESFSLPVEDRIALDAAMEKLSDFQRRLIDLLFYREFTHREVAEALGITQKRVSRELAKTLVRLKELMGRRIF